MFLFQNDLMLFLFPEQCIILPVNAVFSPLSSFLEASKDIFILIPPPEVVLFCFPFTVKCWCYFSNNWVKGIANPYLQKSTQKPDHTDQNNCIKTLDMDQKQTSNWEGFMQEKSTTKKSTKPG